MARPGHWTRGARRWSLSLFCLLALTAAIPAHAQSGGATFPGSRDSFASPVSRDTAGRVVVRATRIAQPLRIDGRLDDEAYRLVPPMTEFIQQVPDSGAPVSERTEMWLLYDDDNIYLTCRCWDENPNGIVANDMRRDSSSIITQDGITLAPDTFNTQRSGYSFTLTAVGALRDGMTSAEGSNFDWNTVFDGAASRFERGWIGEMAVPFKSIRYRPGREQTWGIQLRRNIRSKNEQAFITAVNPAWGNGGIRHFEEAALLVGLEAPPPSRNLEIKPYALSSLTTDRVSRPPRRNDLDPDAGFDVKYGLTEGLTADFTYNTDFAQVEADEAQVNLTRFSISYPEKREFLLESADIFDFGGIGGGSLGGDAPNIFYSRRIGLIGSRIVPVIAGGRLTGRAGLWSLGALDIGTSADDDAGIEQTNFTVVRLKRDVLRQSSVGVLYTKRSASTVASGANDVWGADASLTLRQNYFLSGYLAQSRTSGLRGDDLSYRAQFLYTTDRYGLGIDRLVVEPNFNPEVGFMRREDFRRNFVQARFSPRTADNPLVRQWTYEGSVEYITDNDNRLESRNIGGTFQTEFHSSDLLTVQYSRLYELIPEPFSIARGVVIPVGGYPFGTLRVAYDAGSQHRISGTTSFSIGSFYEGDRKTLAFRGRAEITTRLGVEPNISLNWIDLPQGRFTNSVIGARTIFTVTPRMFVAALVQHSSSSESLSTNLRFRWEYQPGSEVFVVYTEGRSTEPTQGTALENRGVIVKINRLFRF
jgi:hypothetical protein